MLRLFRPSVQVANSIRLLQVKPKTTVAAPQPADPNPAEPRPIDFKILNHTTKVPQQPVAAPHFVSHRVNIDSDTLKLLERLSLVNLDSEYDFIHLPFFYITSQSHSWLFNYSEAIRTLEDSIEFASKILDIPTDNVAPLYTVLEDQQLELRPDLVTDGNCRDAILANASLTEEEYFVAPPGNIPLDQTGPGDNAATGGSKRH